MNDDWFRHAECLGMDTDLFFPDKNQKGGRSRSERALRACDICPVQPECLEYALSFGWNLLPGIWGGTFGNDRKKFLQNIKGEKFHDEKQGSIQAGRRTG